MSIPTLPTGLDYVRTTNTFTNESVPPGLLRTHRVADGVWGQLVVYTGTVGFVFEDTPGETIRVGETSAVTAIPIPPGRQHHVELVGPATFAVEFYKVPEAPKPQEGTESTAFSRGS